MSSFEKLYTVDDIARMTMLTSRTIRTYLKDGLLTGRKIGGQWRFTNEDINRLFANSAVEKEIIDSRRQEVYDFIDGVNTDIVGDIQTCTIVDYYCTEKSLAERLSEQLLNIISHSPASSNRFSFEFLEEQEKARYTFFGSPAYIISAMKVIEDEWNRIYQTQRLFSQKAADYAQFRPSYPKDAVSFLLSLCQRKEPVIADIGSGTGKLSKLLLPSAGELYAVEPNADMREQAEKDLGAHKGYHSVSAAAENTTLPSDSVDLITVAEAYHWFDNEQTKLEFKRILKTSGTVVLIWNQFGDNVYDSELGAIKKRLCENYREKKNKTSKEERAMHLFGEGNYQKREFENNIAEPLEAFIGGSLSASYSPRPGDSQYEEFVTELKRIFEKYSENGLLQLKISTVCFYGKL